MRLFKGGVCGRGMASPLAWRVLAVGLAVSAVVLASLAFTRFDDGAPPASGSSEFRDYHAAQVRDAQASAVLGLVAAFTLLAAFASWQRGGRDPVDADPAVRNP